MAQYFFQIQFVFLYITYLIMTFLSVNTIVAGRPYPIVAGRPYPLWATLHCRGPDGVPVYIAQYDVYYIEIRNYMRTVGGVIYI